MKIIEKEFIKNTLFNSIGNGFSKSAILLSSIFVANIIGLSNFGIWGIIRSTLSMFTIVLDFGIGTTAVRNIAEFVEKDKNKTGRIISFILVVTFFFSAFLSISLLILAKPFAVYFFQNDDLTIYFKYASLMLFFFPMNSVLMGILAGMNKYNKIAIANLFIGFFGAFAIISLSYYFELVGTIFGYSVYYFIGSLISGAFILVETKKNGIRIFNSDFWKEKNLLFNYSVPAIISGSIGGPTIWILNAIVSRMNSGLFILGLYNSAKIFQNMILEFSNQIHRPLISMLSTQDSSERLEKLSYIIPLLFTSIFIFPFIFFPQLLSGLFSSNYAPNELDSVIRIVLFTSFIVIIKQSLGREIIVKNKMWWGVFENILWCCLVLIIIPKLTFLYGAFGLALGFTVSYFIDLLVIFPIYRKKNLLPDSIFNDSSIYVIFILNLVFFLCTFYFPILNYTLILFLFYLTISIKIYSKMYLKTLK